METVAAAPRGAGLTALAVVDTCGSDSTSRRACSLADGGPMIPGTQSLAIVPELQPEGHVYIPCGHHGST